MKKTLSPSQEFEKADNDGDGKLDYKEMLKLLKNTGGGNDYQRPDDEPPVEAQMVVIMGQMDTNRDGFITKKEFLNPAKRNTLFDALDFDGDEMLSWEELDAYMKYNNKPGEQPMATIMFNKHDDDQDGLLSRQEYPEHRQAATTRSGKTYTEDGEEYDAVKHKKKKMKKGKRGRSKESSEVEEKGMKKKKAKNC